MVYEPSLRRTIGVGSLNIDRWRVPLLRYDIPPGDRMAALDAFGVAPTVLRELERQGVERIEYHPKGTAVIYRTTRSEVLLYGICQGFGGRTKYWHLEKKRWERLPYYKVPWLPPTMIRTLDWIDEWPPAVQVVPVEQGKLL